MNEVKEALFDHTFKRAIREIEDLLNLDPDNTQLKVARAELLKSKNTEVRPSEARPSSGVSKKIQHSSDKGSCALSELLNERFETAAGLQEKSMSISRTDLASEARNRTENLTAESSFSAKKLDIQEPGRPALNQDPHAQSRASLTNTLLKGAAMNKALMSDERIHAVQNTPVASAAPSHPHLDFTGEWITRGGHKAHVYGLRKDGAWEGTITGVGMVIWDEEGKADPAWPAGDLMNGVRQGKSYK